MTQLYLITHAHTRQDPGADVVTWQLSEVGRTQALALANQPFWTQIDRVVLSSEPKTRLTIAPLLGQRHLPVVIDHRFDELQRPGWVADYTAQVRQAFLEPEIPAGEWEPASKALARFLAGVAHLCQQFSEETVALVGHGLTFSLYRAYLLGKPTVDLAEWQQLSFAAQAIIDPVAKTILQDFQPLAGHRPRG
ncbi:MAG: phosphoglycerate mutase family protein [Chloroflexi bacterium]|nr:phosphoglycerate mutase family protein [Chloroflexota bacterium]